MGATEYDTYAIYRYMSPMSTHFLLFFIGQYFFDF
nr:MAG TPA: hypothetical protein [Caudoviricetes sp.]